MCECFRFLSLRLNFFGLVFSFIFFPPSFRVGYRLREPTCRVETRMTTYQKQSRGVFTLLQIKHKVVDSVSKFATRTMKLSLSLTKPIMNMCTTINKKNITLTSKTKIKEPVPLDIYYKNALWNNVTNDGRLKKQKNGKAKICTFNPCPAFHRPQISPITVPVANLI